MMCDELQDERRSAAALALQLVDHLQEMGGAESCVIPVLDRGEEYVVAVLPKRLWPKVHGAFLSEKRET